MTAESPPAAGTAVIGDWRLPIAGRTESVDKMRNKPNLPLLATLRSGPRDTRFEIRDTRPPCGRCAKQTQSPRAGRPPLRIWDWGLRRGGDGQSVIAAPNKANLAGWGPANPKFETRSSKQIQNPNARNPIADDVSAAPNKANHAICGGSAPVEHYIWKAAAANEKQSQSAGFGSSRQIRNPKLEIRDKPEISMFQTGERKVWTERQTKPICHFWLHGGRLWRGGTRAIRAQGWEVRDTRFVIRVRRVDRMTNKPNLPHLATSWAASVGRGGPRYEIPDARYAPTVWAARQTKPILAEEASALMMD
jgi:hypothetical protein